MDIHRLKYFISVAKYLNFTKAAEANYITQPTLSRQIASLEKEFGVMLFIRENRNIRLTEEGKCLHMHASKIIREYELAQNNLSFRSGVGSLSIGYDSAGAPLKFFSETNRVIAQQYPKLTIKLYRKNLNELLLDLQREEVDIIIIPICDLNDIDSTKQLDCVVIAEEFKVILPHAHRYANLKSIDLRSLAGEKFIVPSQDTPTYLINFFKKISKKFSFQLSPIYEKAYLEDIVLSVGAGNGFSIVTNNATQIDNLNTSSLCIKNQDIGIKWISCWSKKNKNPNISRYISVLKKRMRI
ncbi:MAG: LysR family transcriptional regulator [Eubacteriaceae bacterium]